MKDNFLAENKINSNLSLRARVLAKIRNFFADRGVIEVETPLLLPTTNPAPYLNSFKCNKMYLQTSPEFAMKRLLAAGSGDIYQICKAFRQNEIGRLHNSEFTILEWYRINFDHHDLMDEVEELLIHTLMTQPSQRFTYKEICKKFLKIDPHQSSLKNLKFIAKKHNLFIPTLDNDHTSWLQLLFTHLIEPNLGSNQPVFIYDFPESQAMLAKTRPGKTKIASRFEVYYKGIELANGYHELNNVSEQRRRFKNDLDQRRKLNLPKISLDEDFLNALPKLPNCSGVALGIDRLLLIAADACSLSEVTWT